MYRKRVVLVDAAFDDARAVELRCEHRDLSQNASTRRKYHRRSFRPFHRTVFTIATRSGFRPEKAGSPEWTRFHFR